MLVGLGVTLFYLVSVKYFGMAKWFGISDVSAGIFGIPAGLVANLAVSLFTPAPDRATRNLVESVRYPSLKL